MGEDDIRKYFDIMVEKMDDHISIIAEGHQMLVERFDLQDKLGAKSPRSRRTSRALGSKPFLRKTLILG